MKKYKITIFSNQKEITKENILIALSYQFKEVSRKQIVVEKE